MSDAFVRSATADDLDAARSFDEWDVVNEQRIADGECWVAGFDGEVLAYGILDRSFMKRQFVAILFVHPEHRQRGLGRALLRHFESLVSDEKLWISTNIENLAMQKMLHAHGYVQAGVINDLGRVPELFFY
ncbi:MAG: GNAT family N-acetyltransferase, partial [Planctomycetota bacterium]